jgi:hypothetical protein
MKLLELVSTLALLLSILVTVMEKGQIVQWLKKACRVSGEHHGDFTQTVPE